MPGKFYRMLVHFGAKRHRCSACRVNFVSFFPRKAEYVNPAKLKRMASMNSSSHYPPVTDRHETMPEHHQPAGM